MGLKMHLLRRWIQRADRLKHSDNTTLYDSHPLPVSQQEDAMLRQVHVGYSTCRQPSNLTVVRFFLDSLKLANNS